MKQRQIENYWVFTGVSLRVKAAFLCISLTTGGQQSFSLNRIRDYVRVFRF